jgi:hypothetical protein
MSKAVLLPHASAPLHLDTALLGAESFPEGATRPRSSVVFFLIGGFGPPLSNCTQ